MTLDELVNRLKATPYTHVLARLSPPVTARGLELTFRERLADVHFRLMTLAEGHGLMSAYYLRQIAWDLKLALKSKALARGGEDFTGYLTMHAEELAGRRDLIVKVIAARDLQEASSLLTGTEFSGDVAAAVQLYTAKREIRVFDLFLDHAVFSKIAGEYANNPGLYSTSRAVDVAGVREMVSLDIDSYNVLSILRAKLWRLPEDELRSLTVPSPVNPRPTFLNELVSTESLTEALKLALGAFPQPTRTQGTDEEMVDSVESYFTHRSAEVARRSFVWQGLGFASAIALTKLLEFEVRNLAAISIGVEAHMDPKNVIVNLVL
jgi:V/A-type H+-transporting ATPase subunit C